MTGINHFEQLFEHFLKTATNVITHFEEKDERNKILNNLEEIIRKNCASQEKNKKLTSTIKELVDNINGDDDPDEIIQEFKRQKDEFLKYNPNIRNNPRLKQYISDVKQIVNEADGISNNVNNDDDIEMTQDNINIIDPFTKKRMINPVKNRVCGHVYDRDSVITILKIKKDTRCPVIGCVSKAHITEENLISDIVTKKFLQKNSSQD